MRLSGLGLGLAALTALGLAAPLRAEDGFARYQFNTNRNETNQAMSRMMDLRERLRHVQSFAEGCSVTRDLIATERTVQVLAERQANLARQLGEDVVGQAAVDLHNEVMEERQRLERELLPKCEGS
jgi:uncharacterized membrane-anchored protein